MEVFWGVGVEDWGGEWEVEEEGGGGRLGVVGGSIGKEGRGCGGVGGWWRERVIELCV